MLLKSKYYYTSKNIAQIRQVYNLKVCYQPHLNFLKFKQNKSLDLSNRVVKGGNYKRSFKNLQYFYIYLLRSNLSNKLNSKFFYFSVTNKNYFVNNHKQYLALNDFNRVLLWKLLQINSIFKIYTKKQKKKKSYIYSHRLKYIEGKFRILIALNWLKLFIKSYSYKNKKNLLEPLSNFLISTPDKLVLTDIKHKVYKLQLLRTL